MLTKIILKILKQNDLCVSDVLKKSLLHEQSFSHHLGEFLKSLSKSENSEDVYHKNSSTE